MKRKMKQSSPKPKIKSKPAHEMADQKSKFHKLFIRTIAGLALVGGLALVIRAGHVAVSVLLVLVTFRLFSECVEVGYSETNKSREIPWYRSLQWIWFAFTMWLAYGSNRLKAPFSIMDSLLQFVDRSRLTPFISAVHEATRVQDAISVFLYSVAFCATVLSLRKGYYALQLRILSFTVLALSLFVVQMKMAIHNVFTGLFWFIFPLLLVAANDSFAYLFGFMMGKKIIKQSLLELSPNKTWEGFIGGAVGTLAFSWLAQPLLSFPWLTCSYLELQNHGVDACQPAYIFETGTVRWHCLLLACYASFVAPFGGFFASAIKRAYGLKDFSNLIPGHGGFLDRLDCQFMMALFTWVHVNTFIFHMPSIQRVTGLIQDMPPEEQERLLHQLKLQFGWTCSSEF